MARIGSPAIYEVAERWKRDCLIDDTSILRPGESLWTLDHVQELVEHFVEKPDTGSGDFLGKLEMQLAPTSPQAKQLAAEMLWLMLLFPARMGRKRKLEMITTVWSWSGTTLERDHPLLGDLLKDGIGHVGTAFNTQPWRELAFVVNLTRNMKRLPESARSELTSDPWRLAEWLATVKDPGRRQMRHVLLHLLFPDHFERIASGQARRAVDGAFAHVLGGRTVASSADQITALDQRLLAIRRELESQGGGARIDFYEEPWLRQWSPNGDQEEPETELYTPPVARSPRVAEASKRPRVWAVGAGEGASRWPEFREGGYIAMGSDELGDLRTYESYEAVRDAMVRINNLQHNPVNDALAAWQFPHEMKVGDEIFIKQGLGRILGYGVVDGDYEFHAEAPDYRNRRRVRWLARGNWELPSTARLPVKTLTDITGYSAFEQFIRPLVSDARESGPEPERITIEQAMSDVFLSRQEFERILASLRRRKNVILQGSPGVGKSFIAKRLAWALIGARNEDQVQMVQFHQSYAYEDFIQGWRPNGQGGFALRNGVFHEFCRRAREHPERPHVFIIDEINRGNLSKVFGELLLLIEADKRGPDFAIPLTYSESATDTFYVPENVHLIGLMNTADRSLAMVDYALRRRFAFITLTPAFETPIFRESLRGRGVPDAMIARILERVGRVNHDIRSDTKNLGPGFEIGHSYFCPASTVGDAEAWYGAVIDEEIRPLLEEYWFDEADRVERAIGALKT